MIIEALKALLFGMGGIFLVMGLITAITSLLGLTGKSKKKQ